MRSLERERLPAPSCLETPTDGGDLGVIPGEGKGSALQSSCLETPTDGGAWRAMVPRVAKSRTRLSE